MSHTLTEPAELEPREPEPPEPKPAEPDLESPEQPLEQPAALELEQIDTATEPTSHELESCDHSNIVELDVSQ